MSTAQPAVQRGIVKQVSLFNYFWRNITVNTKVSLSWTSKVSSMVSKIWIKVSNIWKSATRTHNGTGKSPKKFHYVLDWIVYLHNKKLCQSAFHYHLLIFKVYVIIMLMCVNICYLVFVYINMRKALP